MGNTLWLLWLHQHILRLLPTQHINISATVFPASLLTILSSLSNNGPADLYSLMNPLPPFSLGSHWLWLSASQRAGELLLLVVYPKLRSSRCSALQSPLSALVEQVG